MFKAIKDILRPFVLKYFRYKECYEKIFLRHPNTSKSDALCHSHIILSNGHLSRTSDYVRQICKIFKKVNININDYYIYPLDTWCYREIPPTYKLICSITVDYSVVLKSSLNELTHLFHNCENREFAIYQKQLVDGISQMAQKIKKKLSTYHGDRQKQLCSYFPEILDREPKTFDEALQKTLFYNALFWQANHWHIGLGRLDVILYEYYRHDITNGIITKNQAKAKIIHFCKILTRDYYYKSKALIGDTGQYIMLGGINENGEDASNELTELFLEIFKENDWPDPKLILRVNDKTSSSVWRKAITCVCAGNGSPLFMNEKPIMENMLKFGYDKSDLYQLGTSACWEPLIIGKSFDQNNPLPGIISIKPLTAMLSEGKEYADFESFTKSYERYLADYIKTCIFDINFDCSPLLTLFFDDCIKNEKDFTLGGSKYAYHGIQVVSFPNTINALLNIKAYVFEKRLFSIKECATFIQTNFNNNDDILELLKCGDMKFGNVNADVIALTNHFMDFIGNEVSKYKMNGRPLKVGFSSPNYIMSSQKEPASMDGRRNGEPFAVHISPLSSEIGIMEILEFATHLNYTGNRINGNVVDFTIPSSYLEEQEKLLGLIRDACNHGLFELQLNVLNYEKLKDAKAHPEKYPNLIVRVWGFSSYFKDLPDSYKDVIIERAKLYGAA